MTERKIAPEVAYQMRKDGQTLQQIANHFGVSRQAVQQCLTRHSLPRGTSKGLFNLCIYPNLGHWLRIREYTYSRLAYRLEMDSNAVYQMIIGQRKPSREFIDGIISITGMTEEEAFYKYE